MPRTNALMGTVSKLARVMQQPYRSAHRPELRTTRPTSVVESGRARCDMHKDDAEATHGAFEEADVFLSPPLNRPESPSSSPSRPKIQRQSSLSKPRANGTPRTPHRVRFDLDDHVVPEDRGWVEDEDYLHSPSQAQHAPLLTDITPPSSSPFLADSFQPEDHLPDARPKSNMRSAFMNMANSIIGAGIIGQPYAFRQAGLTMGIVLLMGLTITVDWTIRLIIINSKLSGAGSFQATVQHCFGRPGLIAISLAQWAFAFGGMVAFCIIVGDTIPHVIQALFPKLVDTPFLWMLTDRRAIIVLCILGISWPLSLYRDIAKLAKASTLALISMLIIIFTVVTNGPIVDPALRGSTSGLLVANSGFFQAVGVISFAFVCHHNSLLIYGSLNTPTLDRFSTVTHYSTFISLIACLTMAVSGFLVFGDKTLGNVLNNFPAQPQTPTQGPGQGQGSSSSSYSYSYSNLTIQLARLCFGLNMLTTLPLECFVCREVITTYFFPHDVFNPTRHFIFTTALVAAATTLSLLTCDLGAVFELIGATSACMLAYILPPLCYLKLSKGGWRVTVPAVACIVFGCVVMGISTVMAVARIVTNTDKPKQCH